MLCVLRQKVFLNEAETIHMIYLGVRKQKQTNKQTTKKKKKSIFSEIFFIAFSQSKAELSQRILCLVESFEHSSKTISLKKNIINMT